MPTWSINVDLTEIQDAIDRAQSPDLTTLQQAVVNAASYVRDTWAQAVQGLMLPGMTKPVYNDEYFQSLHTGESLQLYSPLAGAVVSLYPDIDRVESGYPSFDMKPGLLRGPSSRATKSGGRYNVVPFRHMTPDQQRGGDGAQRAHGSTMPPEVYKVVKKTGAFKDPGDQRLGQQLGQRTKLAHQVNLQAFVRKQASPMPNNYTWQYGKYHNMRQVAHQYQGRVQSTYWTYRAVSTESDPSSWIHPGQPPNPVIAAVIFATRTHVEQIILDGARAAFGA